MLDKTDGKLSELTERLTVTAPRFRQATISIKGTAPYVGNKMSAREREKMRAAQEAGQQARSKKKREPKNFNNLHLERAHASTEGWFGIPCSAFRAALIDACRVVGYKMTLAKMSAFIMPDGFDAEDGQPLVRIISKHPPRSLEMIGRVGPSSTDILVRPQWMQWAVKLQVQWDEDQFSASDISNLVLRAGTQVGVGAGRPFSKMTAGLGFGTWTVGE